MVSVLTTLVKDRIFPRNDIEQGMGPNFSQVPRRLRSRNYDKQKIQLKKDAGKLPSKKSSAPYEILCFLSFENLWNHETSFIK